MESPTGGESRKTTVEKKLHALKKLIQSVDALKEKQRAGATLDAQQRAKLARAPALAAELAEFEAQRARESVYRINCFWFKHYDPRWSRPQPRLARPEVVADFSDAAAAAGGARHDELRRLVGEVEARVLALRELGYAHSPRTSAAFSLEFSVCLSNALVKKIDPANPFWTPDGRTVIPHNFMAGSAVNLTDPRAKGVPGTTPRTRAIMYELWDLAWAMLRAGPAEMREWAGEHVGVQFSLMTDPAAHHVRRHTDPDCTHQYGLCTGRFSGGELVAHGVACDYRNKILKFDGRVEHEVLAWGPEAPAAAAPAPAAAAASAAAASSSAAAAAASSAEDASAEKKARKAAKRAARARADAAEEDDEAAKRAKKKKKKKKEKKQEEKAAEAEAAKTKSEDAALAPSRNDTSASPKKAKKKKLLKSEDETRAKKKAKLGEAGAIPESKKRRKERGAEAR